MIIRLTESDLRTMIKDATMRILEDRIELTDNYLTRIPYPIGIAFTDHVGEREEQRNISDDDIKEDVKTAIRQIVDDFIGHKITTDTYFKVIDRDSCNVSVCAISLDRSGRRIKNIVVVTSYIWNGKMNIDNGINYYINDESPAYIEAKEWNEENQDIVQGYVDWKRNTGLKKLARKAEREYNYRQSNTLDPTTRMRLVNKTYDNQAKQDKQAIHDALPPGDLPAIQRYFKDMDKKPLASKFSANRDLRAMDLIRKRKEQQYEND